MYTFEQEILNLPIAGLCTLEMHIDLGNTGHAWSSLVLHILGVHSICTATQRLKIVLLKSEVIVYTADNFISEVYSTCLNWILQ